MKYEEASSTLRLIFFHIALSLAVWASLLSPAFAGEDRLFPSSESASVTMTLKIDGRAIVVGVKNDSRLAITGGTVYCAPFLLSRPRPRLAPDGRKWCYSKLDMPAGSSQMDSYVQGRLLADEMLARQTNPQTCVPPEPSLFSVNEIIFPKKVKEFYFETGPSSPPAMDCRLEDLRGRERKAWEFYK